jgi:hypothetical protein
MIMIIRKAITVIKINDDEMFSETVRLLMSLKVDRLQDERLQWNASYQGRHWLFFTIPLTNKKTAPENRRSNQNNYLVF